MENSTLDFNDIESPATGRHFPIEGRPFAMVMAEMSGEGFVRVHR